MSLTPIIPSPDDLKRTLGSQPPMIPKEQDLGPEPGALPSLGSLPSLNSAPSLSSTLRPIVTSPRQQQEQELQAKISSFENPAKPQGFWQKLGHALAQNPYSMAYRNAGEDRRVSELAGLQGQDVTEQDAASKRNLEGAQTAQYGEETKEAPQKLQQEQQKLDIESQGSSPDMATYRSLVSMGMSPREALQEVEKDKAMALKPPGMEHVSFESGGKQMEGNYDPTKGQYTDLQGNVVKDAKPIPPASAVGAVTMIAPDPGNPGGGIVQRLTPGQRVAPGSQTAAGVNSMNTPTTNQRTAAGRAQTVIDMAPEVISRIDALAPKLGPVEGRWNDFMQGKVGNDDPDFAGLRSDLLMMSSAVALAHAQGRLPENLREEFDKAINSPKQTPENLKATILAMIPWLQQVQAQGDRTAAPTASFKVKLSDAMALPQNKGKSESDVEADVKKHGGEVLR